MSPDLSIETEAEAEERRRVLIAAAVAAVVGPRARIIETRSTRGWMGRERTWAVRQGVAAPGRTEATPLHEEDHETPNPA